MIILNLLHLFPANANDDADAKYDANDATRDESEKIGSGRIFGRLHEGTAADAKPNAKYATNDDGSKERLN